MKKFVVTSVRIPNNCHTSSVWLGLPFGILEPLWVVGSCLCCEPSNHRYITKFEDDISLTVRIRGEEIEVITP